jgi:galactonate dehydratase
VKIRITDVVPHVIFCGRGHFIFVEVQTDQGITGIGEATLDSKTEAVVGAIRDLKAYVIGEDAFRIEHHWQRMFRHSFWRGGVVTGSAISGIEQALWDILGKALGVPVYELLGGAVHDRLRLYINGPAGNTPEEVAASAGQLASEGWTAMKLCPFPVTQAVAGAGEIRHARRVIEGVRRAVGPAVDIAIDCLGRLSPLAAVQMAEALEEYGIFFYEEPILPENIAALAEVAERIAIPVATGERLYFRSGFQELFERAAAQVVQPDLCHCGGLWEGKKIAALAEAYGILFAPHSPYSLIQTMVNLHVDVTCPNFLIQEYFTRGYAPVVRELFEEPLPIQAGGWVERPTKPGLGVQLNWDAVRFYASQPYAPTMAGTPPLWHTDGSVADW